MALQLRLFGEFEVFGPGQTAIALPTRRTGELLARLSLAANRSLDRGAAASEIWPHVPLSSARQSLRKSLSFIRSTLGDVVLADGSGLRLGPGIETDLTKVKSALYRAKLAEDGESAALELTEIDKLTEKPLLSGWDSEWIEPYRSEWKDVRFSILLKLSDHHKHFRQLEAALNFALSASELEPYSEAAAVRVLGAFDEMNRMDDAEIYFKRFADRLESDLDMNPSRDLLETIRPNWSSFWLRKACLGWSTQKRTRFSRFSSGRLRVSRLGTNRTGGLSGIFWHCPALFTIFLCSKSGQADWQQTVSRDPMIQWWQAVSAQGG